ncbi:WXG100-like domain-containing protein, partial [Nocardia sp. NPDC004085]
MTLQIPEAFPDWLVTCVAGHFPCGDEDAARRLGDQWSDTAESCRVLADRHDVAAASERAAIAGMTSDVKTQRNLQLGDDLRNHATYADSMAEQCYRGANDIEFNKLLVIGTGFALLAQLALDAALMAPGVVKAAEDRAAAEASWAAASRRCLLSIKSVGAECAIRRAGIPLAKATAIGAALGAGTGALVNGGAQWWQKNVLHHRDKIEWDQVGDAAVIGGAGGALGARFASRVAPGVNRVIGSIAERSQSNVVRYGAHVTSGLLIGGAGGVAGAAGGLVAQIPLTGHIPKGEDLENALITGFVGGFVGSATVFAQPLPPRPLARPAPGNTNRPGARPTPDPSTPPPGGNGPAPAAPGDGNPPRRPSTPDDGNPPRRPSTPDDGNPPRRPSTPDDGNPPRPNTPKPEEPEPTTPKPDEPEPTTPKPDEPEPTTPKPDEPEPTTPKPDEPEPTTPKPDEPEPTTPKPDEPEPTTPKPDEPEPTTPKPDR